MPAGLKDIDERQVRELALIHCTYKEMAAVIGCHVDTLRDRFSNVIEEGRESGKTSLRRAQFKAALKGNSRMLIWLGKQYLEQSERIEIEAGDITAIFTLKGPSQGNGKPGDNGKPKQIEGEVVPDGDEDTEEGHDNE